MRSTILHRQPAATCTALAGFQDLGEHLEDRDAPIRELKVHQVEE